MSQNLDTFKNASELQLPKPETFVCVHVGDPVHPWALVLRTCKIDKVGCFFYDDPEAVLTCPTKKLREQHEVQQ